MVFGKIKTVGTIIVHIPQLHLVEDTKVSAETIDIATGIHATDDMHPGIKLHAEALEGLKTTTCRGILFEHSHSQALLGKNGSRKQATQSAAYDNCCLHLSVS